LHYNVIEVAGGRNFGTTPEQVTANAGAWTDGLQGQGVVGCLKHFPGIGGIGTNDNPHDMLPVINRTRDQLEATEFAPFKSMIQADQAFCIMSTDVLVPSLDPKYPSEVSQATITGVLRNELHYDGIAITDALYMKGILDTWTFSQAAVLAIEAGNDMVMAPWTQGQMANIVSGLKDAITKGDLTMAQVDASVTRILAVKLRFHILPGLSTTPATSPATTPAATAAQSGLLPSDAELPRSITR
jgi:beta-N-acetylhexosaminidase